MKTLKFLTPSQAIKSHNDGKNQEIKGKFVSQHVFCNVNTLVEYCLRQGFEDRDSPVNIDDLENYYSYPECSGKFADFDGGTGEERDEEIERLQVLVSDLEDQIEIAESDGNDQMHLDRLQMQKEEIEREIEELERLESEPQEVYEWWAVSGYLFERLREMGHVVVDVGSCYVWGRTTTGQAILLDYAIGRICAEMEILEGQENEWKV